MASLPLAPPRSLLWRVPLLAAVYVGLALIGFQFDIEPGFASSIWPAAGVGTAALLVWGLRLWPGVLLGSFSFNWWLSMAPGRRPARALGDAASWSRRRSAAASRCRRLRRRAWAGRCWRPGGVLRSVRQAVPFLIVAGPGSCLLSATTGVAARWGRGRPARRRSVRQLVHVVDGRLDRRPAVGAADVAGAARSAPPALAPGVARRVPVDGGAVLDLDGATRPRRSRAARTRHARWRRCRTSCAS